jgi:hypothetical protein
LEMLLPNVKPLLDDEVEEIRAFAHWIVGRFAKNVLQK